MKCFLCIYNFLKRSLVFPILLFSSISLHWLLRKAFLSLLAILRTSTFKWVYLSFSPLPFTSLLFTAICKVSSDSHFAFLHFFFLGDVRVGLQESYKVQRKFFGLQRVPKNWCFRTVVLEKTLESPLDLKEIQPVHPKGDSPGCSLEGLMLKLKLQYFGHLMRRADSFEKILMLGKIEQEEEGMTNDEMIGWHHQHNGHGFG